MEILFLGTGAADWYLSPQKNMPDFRRCSSVLIDDCFLIDPGPNVIDALQTFGRDISNVKYVINTHNHLDHYNEETITKLYNAKFFKFEVGEKKQIGKYVVDSYKANHSTCENAVHFIIDDGEKRYFTD